jgi:hypothetical protein
MWICGCLKRKTREILLGCDTMGERIGRIRQIKTDFFDLNARILSKKSKKSVLIFQIRPIRFPIVSQPNNISSVLSFLHFQDNYYVFANTKK